MFTNASRELERRIYPETQLSLQLPNHFAPHQAKVRPNDANPPRGEIALSTKLGTAGDFMVDFSLHGRFFEASAGNGELCIPRAIAREV